MKLYRNQCEITNSLTDKRTQKWYDEMEKI